MPELCPACRRGACEECWSADDQFGRLYACWCKLPDPVPCPSPERHNWSLLDMIRESLAASSLPW